MGFQRSILAASVFGTLAASAAGAATLGALDVSGLSVEPPRGATVTTTLGAGTVSEIVIDLTVQHRGWSWGRETEITISAPDGTSWFFDGGDDFGWGYTGTWSTRFAQAIDPTEAEGVWTVFFFDSYDDLATPDYVTRSGSTISFNGEVAPVPLPAALPLALVGVGALGALGTRRRKSRRS